MVGRVTSVKKLRDGKAFVKFDNKEALDHSLQLNGKSLYER